MNRLFKFTSIFGENWVTGRYLIPEIRRLGHEQRGILLDLACGESPFREYFPEVQAYIRIDRDPIDGEVREGSMLSIPQADHSVDLVLLSQAITDVPNPGDVLGEVKRVLSPGGKLIVIETMAYPEHDSPHDYFRLMPDGLRYLGKEAGLAVEECIYLGGLGTRFSSLWNSCVMGKIRTYPVFKPVAFIGTAICNLLCYGLDRLAPHPRLASDYIAVLTNENGVSKATAGPK